MAQQPLLAAPFVLSAGLACLWLLCRGAAAAAGEGRLDAEGYCADPQECGDSFSTLQARRARKARAAPASPSLKTAALAFQGGGFASVANQAAVLSVLLAAATPEGATPSLQGSGLLDKFQTLSSVSGGGWFLSSLLYSSTFVGTIEKMAASPGKASDIFNAEYMQPWFEQAKQTSSGALKAFAALFGQLNIPALSDSLFCGGEILELDGWSGFIDELLYYTTHGDITNKTKLAESLPWANGKTWLSCHSVVSPTEKVGYNRALLYLSNEIGILHSAESYLYRMNSDVELPVFIPAKFSAPLGAGTMADAPLSYVSAEALPATATAQWTASYAFGIRKTRVDTAPLGKFEHFTSQAGSLSVSKAVAAASAAAAGIIVVDLLRDMVADMGTNLGPRLAVWAAAARGSPFDDADAILDPMAADKSAVTDAMLSEIAGAGMLPLADGVYTDNTAIGHCVAAGATEVTAFTEPSYVLKLFAASRESEETYAQYTLGGVLSGIVPGNSFPIFDFEELNGFDSAQAYAEALMSNFSQLARPDEVGKLAYADPISVGTIRCVTKANPWFGIPAGVQVTLNLIMGGTTLGVGAFTDLNNYAATLQSLVGSLAKAAQADCPALQQLRSFFATPSVQLRAPRRAAPR